MASYLHRYLTNFKWLLLIFLVAVIIFTTVICNFILSSFKPALTQAADKYFAQKISVSKVFYLPPSYFVLRNLIVRQDKSLTDKQLLEIPTILVRFSLKEFLLKRHLTFFYIGCFAPKTDYDEFLKFVKDNFSQIISFIRDFPRQDITLSIRGANLDLTKAGENPSHMTAYSHLRIKRNSVSISGYLRKDIENPKGESIGAPLRYSFKGELADDGFVLNKLEFIRQNFHAQLWGNTNGEIFQLNGFMLANTLFKESFYPEPVFSVMQITEKVKSLFKQQKEALGERLTLPGANFYLLDLNSQIRVTFPKIKIDYLTFSLNNIPISLKGDIALGNPVALDILLSGYLAASKEVQENLKKFDLKIAGLVESKTFNGNVMMNLDFVKKKKGSPPLEKVQGDFKELTLRFNQYPKLKMNFKESHLFCQTDTNEYRILLKGFDSFINLHNKRFKLVKFHSLFYDGFLYGQGRLDVAGGFPIVTSIVRVRDVSANRLDGILIHFSKVFGNLDATMHFRNYPDLDLKGRVHVQKGYLNNFEFFKWLAQLFEIPGLRKVDFNKASSHFSVNAKGAGLQEISLESQDVNLSGYFILGKDDLVSSKLSLTFARGLLEPSPKFTPLLRLLDKNLASLAFDFQLSGILHKMNFRWLESDFKKRLQEAIPHFIERRIDRAIEDAIKSISVQAPQ